MTQHNQAVEQQRKKIAKEEDNNTVLSWYFQKSESSHYREVKYKSGRVVTTDLSGKDEIR
jgi:hypothetical protein